MALRNPSESSCEDVIEALQSDAVYGLSELEVKVRLETYGPNKFESAPKDPIYLRYIEQFKDPLIMLLLGSAIVSVLVHQVNI